MSQGKITEKQKEILEFIKETILSKGYPPAVREICEAVHLKSTSSVHSHLETLERNGYIRRDPTKPRTIEILDDDFALTRREVVNVPLIGTVAAGMPILAEENIEDYIPIPAELLPNKEVFMLRVKGNSMVEAGILNDDKVIVAKQPVAERKSKPCVSLSFRCPLFAFCLILNIFCKWYTLVVYLFVLCGIIVRAGYSGEEE